MTRTAQTQLVELDQWLGDIKDKARTYGEVAVSAIVFDPTHNYRWGSVEAMLADLAAVGDDGTASYEALKTSIRSIGVQDPVGLLRQGHGRYRVVYGFTRVRAAMECGLERIPAYIYDALTDDEIRLLQLRENSASLRRSVNWVAEVETYYRLFDALRQRFEAMDEKRMPKDERGRALTAKQAAQRVLQQALGVSPATMKNRRFILRHVDARIVDLSRRGKLSFAAASEFCSGDARAPFSAQFVTEVLEALKRTDPELAHVTSEAVRREIRKLRERLGCAAFEGQQRPVTAGAAWGAGERLSSGALRDLCIDLWVRFLEQYRFDEAKGEAAWNRLRETALWHRTVGIGIGAADVVSPLEDAARFEETAYRYAVTAIVTAQLRRVVAGADGEAFRAWINQVRVIDGAKVIYRVEFHRAVAEAVAQAAHGQSILAVYRAAKHALAEVLAL